MINGYLYNDIKRWGFSSGRLNCVKQTVLARLICKDGRTVHGGNFMNAPVDICPRDTLGMKSGEGYHLCYEVCVQTHHAETDALNKAEELGYDVTDGVMIVIGHTYCCSNCLKTMEDAGLKRCVIIDEDDEVVKRYEFKEENQ